jgi:hypothetical protein
MRPDYSKNAFERYLIERSEYTETQDRKIRLEYDRLLSKGYTKGYIIGKLMLRFKTFSGKSSSMTRIYKSLRRTKEIKD